MGVPAGGAYQGRPIGKSFAGKGLLRSPALGTPLELDRFEETALPRMLAPNTATPLVWGKRKALLQAAVFLFAGQERTGRAQATSRSNAEKDDDCDDQENRQGNGDSPRRRRAAGQR